MRQTYERLPPGGSWRRKATEGERVTIKSVQTESHAGSFHRYRGPPSSRRKALVRRSSAYSGFGLLPDRAWTSTRYACPGRERREMKGSNLKLIFVYVKYTFDILETSSRYDIIITVITKIDFKEITL